jgi:hypothetical protein
MTPARGGRGRWGDGRCTWGSSGRNRRSGMPTEGTYDKEASTTYPETPGPVVIDSYHEDLFALYNEIGLRINGYLCSLTP